MNLLFVGQTFPDAAAPVRGTFNLALCRELAVTNDVRAIVPRGWTERLRMWRRGEFACKASMEVSRAGVAAVYPTCWHLPRIALHRSGRAMHRATRRGLRALSRDFRPEAVLSYWAHPDGRAALEVARELEIPSACIIGGSDVLLVPHYTPKRRREVVGVLCESDAIITISEGLRQAAIELGAPPERIHTVRQGVNTELFRQGEQTPARRFLRLTPQIPLYVWIGRMVEVKRLDLLLSAAALLHQQGVQFQLALVGDGPLAPQMQRLAASLGLENVASFFGPVRQDQLPAWYQAADAVVLSSRSEGLPNVFREALACGRPFLSTDVGSVREIGGPDVSVLTPPNDVQALAAGMREIIRPRYREAAARYVPRTWRECADEVLQILQEQCRRNPASSRPPGKAALCAAAVSSAAGGNAVQRLSEETAAAMGLLEAHR